jgi:hypothetical protein
MSRQTYENIGEYEYKLGRHAEGEYMKRSLDKGYFRNLMVNPVSICMDDGKFGEGKNGFRLLKPIEKDDYNSRLIEFMRKRYPFRASFPIHNEALIYFCIKNGHIEVKI